MKPLLRPRPPLWPRRPSWGVHTHLSNPVGPNISPYIQQNPWSLLETHTHTHSRDFHIRSRLEEGHWNTISRCTSVLQGRFLHSSLPEMLFHHNKSRREWKNHTHLGFEDSGSRSFSTTLIVSVLGRLFGRNTSVLGCRCVCLQAVWEQM